MSERKREQLEEFKRIAREMGLDESADALDKAMDRINPKPPDKDKPKHDK
tara:strand:+ start:4268 stop:4417 length:150 start_codon:yes stop_codon:yes gene_type:complete